VHMLSIYTSDMNKGRKGTFLQTAGNMRTTAKRRYIFLMGDFNARIGNHYTRSYAKVQRGNTKLKWGHANILLCPKRATH